MSDSHEKIVMGVIKFIFLILILIFLTIYFSQATGYYEFELHKKSVFTKEQIQKFEEDVAAGKDVTIEDYLVEEKKDYSNKVSDFGLTLSRKLGNYVKDCIEGGFSLVNKLVE